MATFIQRRGPDGKPSWQARIRLKGHPPESATFKRKTDAERWAASTESAMREGRYFKGSEARRHTLGDLVDRYIREVLPRKSAPQQPRQESQLRWWREELGHLVLADVTPAAIVEARDKLAATPPPGKARRSEASVNRYLAALSHALSVATREWGWLEVNPLAKVSRLREPVGRVRFLSDEERKALLEACKVSPEPVLYPLVLVALSTGARAGELLGLRWPAVDLDRKALRLERTKNRERRALPLASGALEAVRDLGRVRRLGDDRVFPLSEWELRKAFTKACKAAGLVNFHFHDLRHSCASYLAMSGATTAEIAEVLGHKTLAMVKRYSHLTEGHTAGVVERMAAKFLEG